MNPNADYQEVTCTRDEFILLQALLDACDQFVSGNLLARLSGISLQALTKNIEQLNKQGFSIEAKSNFSYRLKEKPESVHPALIRYHLKKTATNFDVLHFPVIDSTNSEAERQHANGRKSPFVVTSSFQTQGRGRLGRKWHSASAKNLYLSVLFEPKIPSSKLQCFTLWAGIYICRILQKLIPNAPLSIKWPNDLYCDGRKFAGMLTEAKSYSGNLHSMIFGIGINVNSNPLEYPDELSSSATSLYAISGKETSLNLLAVYVLQAVEKAYAACTDHNKTELLTEVWPTLDELSGKVVTVIQSGKELSGMVQGIDKSGALLLLMHDNTIQPIHAGEVTLKK